MTENIAFRGHFPYEFIGQVHLNGHLLNRLPRLTSTTICCAPLSLTSKELLIQRLTSRFQIPNPIKKTILKLIYGLLWNLIAIIIKPHAIPSKQFP